MSEYKYMPYWRRTKLAELLDLMRLAVELDQAEWFRELCQEYNDLKGDQDEA